MRNPKGRTLMLAVCHTLQTLLGKVKGQIRLRVLTNQQTRAVCWRCLEIFTGLISRTLHLNNQIHL